MSHGITARVSFTVTLLTLFLLDEGVTFFIGSDVDRVNWEVVLRDDGVFVFRGRWKADGRVGRELWDIWIYKQLADECVIKNVRGVGGVLGGRARLTRYSSWKQESTKARHRRVPRRFLRFFKNAVPSAPLL